ncbi:MAG: HYR domain-containing protein [Verrucomicrobiales bacterium]|nr:HYR domain-containing protein [Verrucomicrobiales bacterium]
MAKAGEDQNVCGLIATLEAEPPASGRGTWTKISGNGDVIFSDLNSPVARATVNSAGEYVLRWTMEEGTCPAVSDEVVLRFGERPIIASQPQSQPVCLGGEVLLSVSARGTEPLNYQWRKGGAVIAGATGASFTIRQAQQADAGSYAVVVGGPCGSVTSAVATVTVRSPVVITTQPQAEPLCVNGTAVLSVTTTGTGPLSYQWRKGGGVIAGATTANYAINDAKQTDAGSYVVVVTGPCGSVTSAVATVTVRSPVVITTQPQGRAVCAGQSFTLSVAAAGTGPLTYQWRKGDSPIAGATSSTYSIPSAKRADAGSYSVLVTGPCGAVPSAPAILEVKITVPRIACPPNISRAAEVDKCGVTISDADLGAATASDDCSTVTMTRTGVPVDNFFPVGQTLITHTAVNSAGDSSTCTQTVTVEDHTPPVARCKNLTLEVDAGAEVTLTASQLDAGSTDNCAVANLNLSKSVFGIADVGINPVTLTVTDKAGNSSTCTATVTVQRKTLPSLSVDDITVTEGNSGLGNATFTVSLSSPAADLTTVDYATVEGTAQAGSDYEVASGKLTFARGEASRTVVVGIAGDNTNEPDEVFALKLSNPQGATIARGEGRCTIRNDDPRPQLSIGDVTVAEGDNGTTSTNVTVRLSSPSGQAVTVNFATSDGTAKAGGDYQTAAGQLTFAPGETIKRVPVEIRGEILHEPDENFKILLSNPSQADLNQAQALVTIRNDDPVPSFSVSDGTVREGDSGSTEIQFSVSLSGPSSQAVSARYSTRDGTASAPSDYSTATGEVLFPAIESLTSTAGKQATRTVPVLQISRGSTGLVLSWASTDDTYELQSMDLLGPPGAWETVNDPVLISNGRSSVTLEPSASLRFYRLVLRNSGTPSLTKTVTVTVVGDLTFEADESFRLVLTAPVNAVLGRAEAEGRIQNDDPLPALILVDGSVAEEEGTANVTLRLSQPSGLMASVKWATADETALANSDYTATNGTITFQPGTVSQTLRIQIKDDSIDEADETFKIVLSEPVNAQPGAKPGAVKIVDNDALPRLTVRDGSALEGNSATLSVALSAASSRPVTVQYATSDGTAKAGADYTVSSGTLTFEPGQTEKLITVAALRDALPETAEQFFVDLSAATNAEIAGGRATVTVTDFTGGNQPPAIRLTNPEPEDQFLAGTSLRIDAVASDPDGRVISVEFFANGRLIGAANAPPYSMEWHEVESSTYLLKAVATDDDGVFTESASVRVIVRSDRFRLHVAVVEGVASGENLEIRKSLNDLDVISEFFSRSEAELEVLKTFDLVIWDDFDAPASALTENHIAMLQELRTAGRPVYFVGTKLLQSADHLSAQLRTTWSGLTRLRATAEETDGVAAVVVPDHRITDGPFGKVENFKLLGRPSENVTRLGELEESLVRSGAVDLVVAYEDGDTLARTVAHNIPISAGANVNALVQTEKLFKNAAWWLMDAADPARTYNLALEVLTEPEEPRRGQDVTYTLTIRHNGEIEARGLSLVLTIPDNMTFVSATSENGPCEAEEGNVICHLGTLTSGSIASVNVLMRATAAGPATTTLSASSTLRFSTTHTVEVSP